MVLPKVCGRREADSDSAPSSTLTLQPADRVEHRPTRSPTVALGLARWAAPLVLAAPRVVRGVIDFVGVDTGLRGRVGSFDCDQGWLLASGPEEFALYAKLQACGLHAVTPGWNASVVDTLYTLAWRPAIVALDALTGWQASCIGAAAANASAVHPDQIGWKSFESGHASAAAGAGNTMGLGMLLAVGAAGAFFCCFVAAAAESRP